MTGSGKRGHTLSADELAEWEAIARTIVPLPNKRPALPTERPHSAAPAPAAPALASTTLTQAVIPAVGTQGRHTRIQSPAPLRRIEPRVLRALKRGQLDIEARLDLHGETQASAHRALVRFLTSARGRGLRIVLIVTGKGLSGNSNEMDGGRGVLRRMVPEWLSSPSFAPWILGVSSAAPAHGGSGAFYLALRRER